MHNECGGADMKVISPDWSVAIFAAREAPATLRRCIGAAVAACAGRRAVVDVLVNGNRALAAAVAQQAWEGEARVRIWNIEVGDKAHAWNEYLHRVWPGGRPAFFIDGYTELRQEVLAALYWRVAGRDPAGLDGRGHMLKTGGQHANVHALGIAEMAALRARGVHLPLGLYRTDSLIGAVLAFGLEQAGGARQARELDTGPASMVRSRPRPRAPGVDAGAAAERAARPAVAVQRPPRQLIHDWLVEHPRQSQPLFFKRPLCLGAARKLKAEQDWSALWTAPELVSPAAHR